MSKLCTNWKDLVGLETDDYYIEVDLSMECGWVTSKKTGNHVLYLNTHAFYKNNYSGYTKMLQEYGFDVELFNWG